MIIEDRVVATNSVSPYARKTKKITLCKCDQCGAEFTRARSLVLYRQKHHFCSCSCESQSRKKDGGVAYKFQLSVRDSQAWYAKVKETFKERFGGHPFANKAIREKALSTIKQRYGVDCLLKLAEIRALACTPEMKAKCFETMKKNCTYAHSKPEDNCYNALVEKFGVDDVVRQQPVCRWLIDFYIKSIDTYVQLDGVYWHGLDRPIEVIAEHKTKRDVQIHKRWIVDREQNQWFSANNLRLIRITDKEFKKDQNLCMRKICLTLDD
jgi:very-short-patch-repair endonuclease